MSQRPVTKTVAVCGVCPFVDDGTDMEPGFGWTCHAEYTVEGWPKKLGDHPPPKPPDWCALRKRPILVKLSARRTA